MVVYSFLKYCIAWIYIYPVSLSQVTSCTRGTVRVICLRKTVRGLTELLTQLLIKTSRSMLYPTEDFRVMKMVTLKARDQSLICELAPSSISVWTAFCWQKGIYCTHPFVFGVEWAACPDILFINVLKSLDKVVRVSKKSSLTESHIFFTASSFSIHYFINWLFSVIHIDVHILLQLRKKNERSLRFSSCSVLLYFVRVSKKCKCYMLLSLSFPKYNKFVIYYFLTFLNFELGQ